jgi:hypothetical protein
VNVSFPEQITDGFQTVIGAVGYIIPPPVYLGWMAIFVALRIFKIAVAIVIRVKSFVPTMGA